MQWTSPLVLGQREQLGRLLGRHRERLLAHDVLPGGEHLLGLRVMEVVRRRQVHDVDRLVREQRVERVVDRRDPLRGGALRRRAHHTGDLDAEEAERVDVDDADEPRSDDTRAERRQRPGTGVRSHAAYATPDVRRGAQPIRRGRARCLGLGASGSSS